MLFQNRKVQSGKCKPGNETANGEMKVQSRKCDLENENCKQENANRLLKICTSTIIIRKKL